MEGRAALALVVLAVSGLVLAADGADRRPGGTPAEPGFPPPAANPASPPGTGTPTVPGGRPTTAAPGRDGTIPDAALLRPADLGPGEVRSLTGGTLPYFRPPKPCRDGRYSSDADLRTSRAITGIAIRRDAAGGPVRSDIFEYLAWYRPGGAVTFVAELRLMLGQCPGTEREGLTFAGESDAGDESVLMRYARPERNVAEQEFVFVAFLVVARTGDAVVVVADLGWEQDAEGRPGDPAVARTLAARAVRRARVLG